MGSSSDESIRRHEGCQVGDAAFRQHSSTTCCYYWATCCAADRYYWDAWDPVHVCEGLFAVGNILNFTRMFHLLAINEHLGPMLISLERMIKVSRYVSLGAPSLICQTLQHWAEHTTKAEQLLQ